MANTDKSEQIEICVVEGLPLAASFFFTFYKQILITIDYYDC